MAAKKNPVLPVPPVQWAKSIFSFLYLSTTSSGSTAEKSGSSNTS